MTLLAPLLLLLGLAVAVPLLLHLLQRQQGPRVTFPALRYLRRAEREHATRIRLRQVLLLALRVLALLLLALAAARPFLRGAGGSHRPTSVVLVLDNSLSTGAVIGDRRVLDVLRASALATLAAADDGDRFWLIRAGAPWEPAVPGAADAVADAVRATRPSGAAADLAAAVERAASILATEAPGRAREIHLLSDLQATSLPPVPPPAAGPDTAVVRVLAPDWTEPPNRGVTAVEVGGGLPPRVDRASTVAATVFGSAPVDGVAGAGGGAGTGGRDTVVVRLVVGSGVVGAGAAVLSAADPGAGATGSVVLRLPARPAGLVTGAAQVDADALVADDRRWFVVRVVPPPVVALTERLPFLDEALGVLADDGRIRRGAAAGADVVVAPAARGADALGRGAAVVLLPPSSPLELAAANRRLADAGVPWRLAAPLGGEARLAGGAAGGAAGADVGGALAEVRLREVYGLERAGTAPDTVLLRLADGSPWAVAGTLPAGGRYVLLATPLTPEGSTIPTSAAMLPLLDRAVASWSAAETTTMRHGPGDVITLPGRGTGEETARVVGPDSVGEDVDAGGIYRLREAGVYRVYQGDTLVAAYAVNPPGAESDLRRLTPDEALARIPGRSARSAPPARWADVVFHRRLGRGLTAPLLGLALLVLLVEAAVAAAGRRTEAA